MRIEYRGEEQQYQHAIDDIREGIIEAVIEHQDDESQGYRRAYPDNLHARASTEAEYIIVTISIAGTADAHPSEDEQRQIDAYRPPVE